MTNSDSIRSKLFEEGGGRFGGGRRSLSPERFPLPSPNPSSLPPKTFDWWGGRAEGVLFCFKKAGMDSLNPFRLFIS